MKKNEKCLTSDRRAVMQHKRCTASIVCSYRLLLDSTHFFNFPTNNVSLILDKGLNRNLIIFF